MITFKHSRIIILIVVVALVIVGIIFVIGNNNVGSINDVLGEVFSKQNNSGIKEVIVYKNNNGSTASKVVVSEEDYDTLFQILTSIEVDTKDDMYNIDATKVDCIVKIELHNGTKIDIEIMNDYESIFIASNSGVNSYRILYPDKVKTVWENLELS